MNEEYWLEEFEDHWVLTKDGTNERLIIRSPWEATKVLEGKRNNSCIVEVRTLNDKREMKERL